MPRDRTPYVRRKQTGRATKGCELDSGEAGQRVASRLDPITVFLEDFGRRDCPIGSNQNYQVVEAIQKALHQEKQQAAA